MNDTKPWYTSKTIWVNAIAAVLAVAEVNFHLLAGKVSPEIYVMAVSLLAGVNLILRAVTTTGISLKDKADVQ